MESITGFTFWNASVFFALSGFEKGFFAGGTAGGTSGGAGLAGRVAWFARFTVVPGTSGALTETLSSVENRSGGTRGTVSGLWTGTGAAGRVAFLPVASFDHFNYTALGVCSVG